MIIALVIVIALLLIALWISAMALWWRHEQGRIAPLQPRAVIRHLNKAARLGRRSLYSTMRYSKRAGRWGNRKVSNAFVAVFPKAKAAFTKKDMLTGLQHGPSSYFLASLSKRAKKKTKPSEDLSV
ncbi:MAG: hypothetical protein JWM92_479 [Candidatus Nomurabacteria bacterium]|jgi:uncharacterized protein YqfA (UPF0365 family)|nr:hypothetical protein [Candidatus Nomurabacteria bacterium]